MMAIEDPWPDGARIEWVYCTDVFAAWKDTASSVRAGWPAEMSWVIYPGSVPRTYAELREEFEGATDEAVLLCVRPTRASIADTLGRCKHATEESNLV